MDLASNLGLSIQDILTIKRSQQSNEPGDKNAIFQVLYRWTSDLTTSPPLEQLVHCLMSLEFEDAAGKTIQLQCIHCKTSQTLIWVVLSETLVLEFALKNLKIVKFSKTICWFPINDKNLRSKLSSDHNMPPNPHRWPRSTSETRGRKVLVFAWNLMACSLYREASGW